MTANTIIRVHRNNQDIGYFTPDMALQNLRNGVLRADDWAFYEGLSDWMPLEVLLEQSDILPGSTPIAVPPMLQIPPLIPHQTPLECLLRTSSRLPVSMPVLIAAASIGLVLVFLIFSSNQTSKADPKIPVSADEFGSRWPLTVSNGFVIKLERYIPNSSFKSYSVIFESPDGIRYGLNGHALTEGYRDIHAITKYRIEYGNPIYEDVSWLINIGLKGKR